MKKVFITGGTTGIGLALAEHYLSLGYRVGICARDLSKLDQVKLDHPNFYRYQADVMDKEKLTSSINHFCEQVEGLDILIANAGISVGSKNKMPDFDSSRRVIETNVIGVLNTFEPGLSYMLKNGGGHLVCVASVAGYVGLPGASSYSASKAAVLKLCESYAIDLKDSGITTTAIAPGFIATPLTDKNDHAMPFMMSAEKAASKIVKAIARKEELFIFPWQMKIAIYVLDRMPRWIYRRMMRIKLINYSRGE